LENLTKSPAKLLTDFLKQVGEETEQITVDGQIFIATKAEIMARRLYLMANGGVEEYLDEKGVVCKRIYQPDRRAIELILNRTEGRPAVQVAGGGLLKHTAKKFDNSMRGKLTDIMENDESESTID